MELANINPDGLSEDEDTRIQGEFDAVADLAVETWLETGEDPYGLDMRLTFPDGSFLDMFARPGTKTSIRLSDGTLVEEHGWRY